jgi:hypothetical protein
MKPEWGWQTRIGVEPVRGYSGDFSPLTIPGAVLPFWYARDHNFPPQTVQEATAAGLWQPE